MSDAMSIASVEHSLPASFLKTPSSWATGARSGALATTASYFQNSQATKLLARYDFV